MKKPVLLVLLLLLFCISAFCQTTRFWPGWDDKKVCENPWKGWYQHYYDASTDNYPVAQDSYLDNFPGMDHIYIRLPWASFEPTEENYDWSRIDDLINKWGPKGYRFAIRVTTYDPWVIQYSTPQWVKNAGAKGELITPEWATAPYWEPNYNDEIFMAKWRDFQADMAARYNNNRYISYIDIGGVGCWGEGHSNDGDKKAVPLAVLKSHADAYKNYWKKPLVVADDFITYNVSGAERTDLRNYLESRGIWYRDDSPLVDWYVKTYPSTYSVQTPELFNSTYQYRPNILETQHYHIIKNEGNWTGTDGATKGAAMLRGAIKTMHATYIGFHSWADIWLAENPNLAKQLANECGYWYFIEYADLPNSGASGQSKTFSLKWVNMGVAPAYNQYQIKFKFAGSSATKYVVLNNSNNKTWMDGKGYTENYTFTLPAGLSAGSNSVRVKLYDTKSGRDIDLGIPNTAKDSEGYFRLGTMNVTATARIGYEQGGQPAEEEAAVYPTLSRDGVITIDVKDRQRTYSVAIFNGRGNRISITDRIQGKHVACIAGQPDGLYIVRISSGTKSVTKKVILLK